MLSDSVGYLSKYDNGDKRVKAYIPLPLDLFPRPDPAIERQESAESSCYKYFDMTKFTRTEALAIAAMDLIPKDAIVKSQPRPVRTRRSRYLDTPAAENERNSNGDEAATAEYQRRNEDRCDRVRVSVTGTVAPRRRGRPRKRPLAGASDQSPADGANHANELNTGLDCMPGKTPPRTLMLEKMRRNFAKIAAQQMEQSRR